MDYRDQIRECYQFVVVPVDRTMVAVNDADSPIPIGRLMDLVDYADALVENELNKM